MLSLVGQFSLMRLKKLSVLVHGDIHVHLSTVFKKTTVRKSILQGTLLCAQLAKTENDA